MPMSDKIYCRRIRFFSLPDVHHLKRLCLSWQVTGMSKGTSTPLKGMEFYLFSNGELRFHLFRSRPVDCGYLFPTGSSQSYFNKDVPDYRRIMLGRHPSPHRSTRFCPIIVGSRLHSWDRTKEHVGCAAQVWE